MKRNFSNLAGIIETKLDFVGSQDGFVHDDILRNLLFSIQR